MKSRVFLSHSSQDKAFAIIVVDALRSPSLEPWIDTEKIITGDDIFDKLGDGLKSMDLMVFLASEASLASEWVTLETKFAVKREIQEKRTLILPFVVDETPLDALPWFLQIRNASRVKMDANGAKQIAEAVQMSLERRLIPEIRGEQRQSRLQRHPRIDNLIVDVDVGDWAAAYDAAVSVFGETSPNGENELFTLLVSYIDLPVDDDMLWGTLLTIEGVAQLAPWLLDRDVLYRMSTHPNFSVRSTAASICMEFASSSPSLVPTDLMVQLANFDEDWYVMAPATAALKALCATRPAIQRFLFSWLHSDDPQEREHAASAIADIASEEPEILEPGDIEFEAKKLSDLGDKVSSGILEKALASVRKSERGFRYKYGI